ncbi:NlpC/P60 family protein [Cognatiyoonia sp. IB215182]|uniref:NlpC/P60 family protein n=1 Tax=Cognatiyoonia sp. IB215182 TaxID=3097353 RepID=UPI002A1491FB|nr:NlpC/P60 family protein [Cognatiyoonia sp. IB215182]MDX8352210.1 peptidase [Cognatiyoonia sp. IB215182]
MSVAIVEAARSWIGTPYLHQASRKSVGCDCLGLLRGVWREVFGAEPEQVPIYTADWSEPQGDERLYRAAMRHMRRVDEAILAPGQVLLFRMREGAVAKHLGIVSAADPVPRFIHAYAGHGVCESPLSQPWRKRIVARFEISQG